MTLKNTLILVCAVIAAVGIVVQVARGKGTVFEGLFLFVLVGVFLGACAILDADDWSSGHGGGDGGDDGWFGGDGDAG